jgi:transcriptional regulator with XRE-family HTH domain/ubiquinone/menaquinone biosynthesis C-methylase UbiE
MIDKINFAKKLVDLRNKCGLSQNKLADMLYISGQAVSKWETASSLPDIELLLPLSQILGVSADYLLGNERNDFINNNGNIKESVSAYDISDENINILTAMSGCLSREYLFKAAKYIEKDMFDYKLTLELISNIENKKNYYRREIDLLTLEKDALAPYAKQLSNLTLQALYGGYNPIRDILGLMKCPDCGKDFEYFKTPEDEYISCGEHRFEINEGVTDFKSFEIPGYTWSSWIRRYEDYKKQYVNFDLTELNETDKNIIRELQKYKPPVILDIGSGSACGVKKFMKHIDWECTIILTDLSHRILKYDKRYIDENTINPQVKIVCLACDVRNLPFKDDSIPFVLSYGGYFCISYGLKKSIIEGRRVLIPGGRTVSDMGVVSDKKDQNVQKWLNLIKKEIGHEGDMMDEYYKTIYDVMEWHELIKECGFTDFEFVKIKDEICAPETDAFPYNCEISRWMGLAFITAIK